MSEKINSHIDNKVLYFEDRDLYNKREIINRANYMIENCSVKKEENSKIHIRFPIYDDVCIISFVDMGGTGFQTYKRYRICFKNKLRGFNDEDREYVINILEGINEEVLE